MPDKLGVREIYSSVFLFKQKGLPISAVRREPTALDEQPCLKCSLGKPLCPAPGEEGAQDVSADSPAHCQRRDRSSALVHQWGVWRCRALFPQWDMCRWAGGCLGRPSLQLGAGAASRWIEQGFEGSQALPRSAPFPWLRNLAGGVTSLFLLFFFNSYFSFAKNIGAAL